jgi:D-serine deaminase-like pyridoxal phosphate-dependent protein
VSAPSQPDAPERGRTPIEDRRDLRSASAHSPDAEHTRADAERSSIGQKDPQSDLRRLERATADLDPPFALVDLDALWTNARDLERRAAHKPIRLASKSLRCRALQTRVLARDGFAGTLAFTLPEAIWLVRHEFEDVLVAYPTVDRAALRELAGLPTELPRARVTVMVDDLAQLDLIDAACAGAETPIRVCIDLDAGYRALRGRIAVGAKRSPVHTPAQAVALARAILARDTVELVGIMSYEAHIAGLGDAPPARPLRALAIRALQSRSARELATRRAQAVAAVRELAPLEFVNAGGTGSLHSSTRERAVTELTAGSGLYGPALFDSYRAFTPRPAALFALPVVRRPGPRVATVLGGGYLASGPADAARLPAPYLPAGLRLDSQEGAGEVQTPLLGNAAAHLAVGDRVWLRHAKAGELCERFVSLHLLAGDRIVEELPTYRGEGQCFL